MPIVLDMAAATRTDIRFVTSGLVELGAAWHVVAAAGHHPERAAWVADVRGRCSAEVAAALEDWSFTVRAVRATMLADPTLVPGRRWRELLGRVRSMPPADFAASVLRPLARRHGRPADLADASLRDEVLRLARARGQRTLRTVRSVLDDPASARAAFTGLLDDARKVLLGDADDAGASLADEVIARSALLERDGWSRALTDVSPAVRVDAVRARVVVDKVQNKRLAVAGRGLVVVPSVLGAGHIYVADEPNRPVVVHYPVPPPERATDTRTTARRLSALAHPARLEVCRAIAVEPRSAREIARLWRMSEPSVTKHLSALRAAGLVRSERVGHYVRYALDEAAIAGVGSDLLDVLRR